MIPMIIGGHNNPKRFFRPPRLKNQIASIYNSFGNIDALYWYFEKMCGQERPIPHSLCQNPNPQAPRYTPPPFLPIFPQNRSQKKPPKSQQAKRLDEFTKIWRNPNSRPNRVIAQPPVGDAVYPFSPQPFPVHPWYRILLSRLPLIERDDLPAMALDLPLYPGCFLWAIGDSCPPTLSYAPTPTFFICLFVLLTNF